jgi:hypothetical protein
MLEKIKYSFRLVLLLALTFINTMCTSQTGSALKKPPSPPAKKYIAFTCDTEAYFCPPSFESWQGVFTMDMVRACEKENIPFTWLVICDRERDPREFREIDAMMKTVWPLRKGIDDFGIHTHFNYFINDIPGDEVWKIPERRIAFLKAALARRQEVKMPAPVSFRYGGGDMRVGFYLIEDIRLLHSAGVRNYLLPLAHDLSDIKGLEESQMKHRGNNVWQVEDMEDITLFRGPRSSLERPTNQLLQQIDDGLTKADYITVTCHDYTAIVSSNISAAVRHARSKYDCEFVTIARIGELIRAGKIKNEF